MLAKLMHLEYQAPEGINSDQYRSRDMVCLCEDTKIFFMQLLIGITRSFTKVRLEY